MLVAFLKQLLRFLSLCAFAFWQGGFVFYAGVVVPLGSEMWGDRTQGFLTRQVAPWLHVAGGVAIMLWLLDGVLLSPWRKSRFLLALSMGLGVVVLVGLYPRMDAHLDPITEYVEDPRGFRFLHRIYLWLCTAIWVLSLIWLWLISDQRNEKSRRNLELTEVPATLEA